ncbi:MAG: bacteriohemerythrin [Nannocystaceae bacterium]
MSLLQWSASLDVGVGSMNREHHVLIGLMNVLWEADRRGAPRPELLSALKKLGDYTVEHFEHEERMLAAIRFPQLATHRRIHANLLGELKAYVDAFAVSEDARLPKKLFTFLKLWLTAHIRGIDIKYSALAQSKGLAA